MTALNLSGTGCKGWGVKWARGRVDRRLAVLACPGPDGGTAGRGLSGVFWRLDAGVTTTGEIETATDRGGGSFAGRGRWPGIRGTDQVCHVVTSDKVRTVAVLDAMMVV